MTASGFFHAKVPLFDRLNSKTFVRRRYEVIGPPPSHDQSQLADAVVGGESVCYYHGVAWTGGL